MKPTTRYRAVLVDPKTGERKWSCKHFHAEPTEAGDCAADHMAEVVTIHIEAVG